MRTLLALLALLALPLAGAHAQVKEGWDEPPAQTQPAAEEDAPRGGPVIPPANATPLLKDMEDLEKAADGIKKTGESIIQRIEQIITAQVFFPAKTFRGAVEDAATGIAEDLSKSVVDEMVDNTKKVVKSGEEIIVTNEVVAMVKTMQQASVAILGIGLAIAILGALAGEAAGLGSGPSSMGGVFVRWMFVALVTANASTLLILGHNAFGSLTEQVVASANAGTMLDLIFPKQSGPGAAGINLIGYFVLIIVAIVVGLVIIIANFARLAVLAILHVIAPLCIASASVPFGIPIFGQWLWMFIKAELLGVANGVLMTLGMVFASRAKDAPLLISPIIALAIFGVLLTLNLSVLKGVFGGMVAMARLGINVTGSAVGALRGGLGGMLAASIKKTPAPPDVKGKEDMMGADKRSSTSAENINNATGTASGLATVYAGAKAGWEKPIETMVGVAEAGDARVARVGELTNEIASSLGVRDAAGQGVIARAVREGVDVGGGNRISGEQLAQNARQTAPVIRSLVEQFGDRNKSDEERREQAAAKLGFSSYADMTIALSAYQNAQGATPQEVIGETMNAWMQSPPGENSPLWDKDAPHDYAVGTFVSRVAGSAPGRAPLWAKTMGSLRRAFGDAYVADFTRQAAEKRWGEKEMMSEIDAKVASARKSTNSVESELANKVVRFWRPEQSWAGEKSKSKRK